MFDCLHDMGDPVGTAPRPRHARPARIAEVVADAGFSRFRQAAATPFNLVYEVRP